MQCSKCHAYIPEGLNLKVCLSCGTALDLSCPTDQFSETDAPMPVSQPLAENLQRSSAVRSPSAVIDNKAGSSGPGWLKWWVDHILGWSINFAGAIFWFEGGILLLCAAIVAGVWISGIADIYARHVSVLWFTLQLNSLILAAVLGCFIVVGLLLAGSGTGLMRKTKWGAFSGLVLCGLHIWGSFKPSRMGGVGFYSIVAGLIIVGISCRLFHRRVSESTGALRRRSKAVLIWGITAMLFAAVAGVVAFGIRSGKIPLNIPGGSSGSFSKMETKSPGTVGVSTGRVEDREALLREELGVDLLEENALKHPENYKSLMQLHSVYVLIGNVAKIMPGGFAIAKKYEQKAEETGKHIDKGNFKRGWEFYYQEAERTHSVSRKVSDYTFESIDKAVELMPENPALYFTKASYLFQNRRWAEGIKALQKQAQALIDIKAPREAVDQGRMYLAQIGWCFDLDGLVYTDLKAMYDGPISYSNPVYLSMAMELFRNSRDTKIQSLIAQYDADPRFDGMRDHFRQYPGGVQKGKERWLCDALQRNSFS